MHGVLWYLLTGLVLEGALGSFQYWINRDVMKKEKRMDRRRFVMRLSPVASVVFLICFLVSGSFIVIGLATENETFTLWVFLLFATASLFGFFVFLKTVFDRYVVEEEKLILVRLFRRKKTLLFNEISRATVENRGEIAGRSLYLYQGERRVATIESAAVGFDLLICVLREKKISCIENRPGLS